MSVYIDRFRELSRRAQAGLFAFTLALGIAAPALLGATVSAAPTPTLSNRQLTSTTARPGQPTQLAWTFNTTADVANANKIEIEFCDQPLGACTITHTPTVSNTSTATLSGPWTTTTVTSTTRGDGRNVTTPGSGSVNQLTILKTTADSATSKTGLVITLGASDITNFSTANSSYYTRMRIYSDAGSPPTALVWQGVFAQSTSQTLTVNARVQERLDFCVGATTVDDATTSVGADCSTITGSSVDIGNIDNGNTNVSPVTTTNGGDGKNGVAMIRTNAVNGAVINYKALQDNSSGGLKVPGATCNATPSTSATDQCFNDSSTQGAFTAGTEKFGMTIAGINCGSSTAYGCTFSTGAYNLQRDGAYDGNGANTFDADHDQVAGTTTAGYAWQSGTGPTAIASSTGSTVKVLDDEAMILKFAATSGITTPTGAYTVQADFIATTTF